MKIIDLHCDSIYKFFELGEEYSFKQNNGHLSENALVKGGYLAQCFAIYTPFNFYGEDAYSYFKSQYEIFSNMLKKSMILRKAQSGKEIESNKIKNKISAILTIENAEFLNGKLERVSEIENMGVKFLGLIHNHENCIGFPHSKNGENHNIPLKKFGREVVDILNDHSIFIDVSHLNFGGFIEVAKLSKKPFIASHSACYSLKEHSRNLTDEQIKIIAESGGIVGIPFYSKFLNGTDETKLEDIIYHLEYLIKVGGQEVVALGSDFDGIDCQLFLKNGSEMQILANAIVKNFGFSLAEKICYKNAMRIIE